MESRFRVKLAYPLRGMCTEKSQSESKKAIEEAKSKDGALTPMGYDIGAAVRVLDI